MSRFLGEKGIFIMCQKFKKTIVFNSYFLENLEND